MKFHFCQNDLYEIHTRIEFQTHMRIKRKHPTSLRLFLSSRVNYVHMKTSCRFEISFRSKWPIQIHTVLSFILLQFMWTQVKSWLNTKVRFSTEIKSHTGLSSFHFLCECTHRYDSYGFIIEIKTTTPNWKVSGYFSVLLHQKTQMPKQSNWENLNSRKITQMK